MLSLSVIIPTYNRKASLLRALDALARQTYPADAFEVVVVSDGATDGTADDVRKYKAPYALTLLEQLNQGPSVARNNGAKHATAPLLVYVDDDVEPLPRFLQEHAQSHESDESMPAWIAWEHNMLQRQYTNLISGAWSAGPNHLYSGNFSLRREHLLRAGGFEPKFTRQEDVELGFRLAKAGLHFQFNPNADAIHRPSRTFASWYRTPYEYGRRDVQMSRDMGEAYAIELARSNYRTRSLATRILARTCIGRSILERIVFGIGGWAVRHLPRQLALLACSVVFNLRYLEGMCDELGGRKALWQTLAQNDGSSATK